MAKQQLRSRGGCRECRRMHRKCSEHRPSCEYCSSTGKECSYDKPLRWGGRSFKKSCFGQVLSSGAVVKQSHTAAAAAAASNGKNRLMEQCGSASQSHSFVYGPGNGQFTTGTASTPLLENVPFPDSSVAIGGVGNSPSSLSDLSYDQTTIARSDSTHSASPGLSITSPSAFTTPSNDLGRDHDADVELLPYPNAPDSPDEKSCSDLVVDFGLQKTSSPINIILNPDWLPWLSNVDRSLLNHFTLTVSSYLSLHQAMQNDFCTVLLPMALDTSNGTHLLSAILGLAAIHQISLGSYTDEAYLAQLRYTSLQQLRLQRIGQNAAVDEQSIATALTLCLCDILAGGEKPKSWRLHLQGAATMIRNYFTMHPPDSGNILVLWRWWKSLQSLSTLLGNPASRLEQKPLLGLAPSDSGDYIDLYDGFSTKLPPLIEEVDLLHAESQALERLDVRFGEDEAVQVLRNAHSTRCEALLGKVSGMIDNPVTELEPSGSTDAQPEPASDYFSLNEAYHLAVMLQIYQRAMNVSIVDDRVQELVERGIKCLSGITIYEFASPGVATLQPLFIFGCAAQRDQDKQFVMGWIERMRRTYSLRNTDSARDFLLELWRKRESMGSMGTQYQYHQLLCAYPSTDPVVIICVFLVLYAGTNC
ncbi:hypothetical protein PV08_03129 [Exophiala spinifera]|uniref:Zn(2)-C6 fungal-type domain-containing protein n=1 Tax=Exophiala spinifera TaxID=91928 RepID=A0A0D2BJR8_9EURO|nr:uncharacterized protein PV08_03129 [Exophiala spinifera]KIW18840.1 hypothetical protein PV08_03129 [Exophiala spinifera]